MDNQQTLASSLGGALENLGGCENMVEEILSRLQGSPPVAGNSTAAPTSTYLVERGAAINRRVEALNRQLNNILNLL